MRLQAMSGRQYAMLQALYDAGIEGRMTIDEAQHFDQRPFRSMLIRGWCAYRSASMNRGFHVTKEGRQAMEDFHAANIARSNPTLPLTSYFDPVTYRLGGQPGKKAAAKAPRGPAPDNLRAFVKKQAS